MYDIHTHRKKFGPVCMYTMNWGDVQFKSGMGQQSVYIHTYHIDIHVVNIE